MSAVGAESIRLELRVAPRARAGEPVPITLRVQNVGPRAVDLYLRGRTATFDVVVARATGQVVWRRLEGEIIPAIVHLRPLKPGERLASDLVWDQRTIGGEPLASGEYVVQGLLLVEGEPLRTPKTSFQIIGFDD